MISEGMKAGGRVRVRGKKSLFMCLLWTGNELKSIDIDCVGAERWKGHETLLQIIWLCES